jgi:hypothetical protein
MNKIIYEKLQGKMHLIPDNRQHYFYKFPKQLFTTNNTKIIKGMKKGVLTGILHMLPDRQVKDFLKDATIPTVCPTAKIAGCFKDCLVFSGRGNMSPVFYSRLRKTLFYLQYKKEFIKLVDKEISRLLRKAEREGLELAIRINGTSDIPVLKELKEILLKYANVKFYDYTKNPKSIKKLHSLSNEITNYHLTFSYTKEPLFEPLIEKATKYNSNIAIVFQNEEQVNYLIDNKKKLKLFDRVYNIINGDKTDLRYKDKNNSIVALRYKKPKINGKLQNQPIKKNFVVNLNQLPNNLTLI